MLYINQNGPNVFYLCVCLQDKVYQFCSKACCEDYKKLHCIVTFCEYCQEEKTLHETVKFSGVKRPFCSEGTYLLSSQGHLINLSTFLDSFEEVTLLISC